jgi:ABC-type transport system substrate-binding protein
LDQARRTASDAERRKLYGQVARIANDDGPYMYAWVANRADAWRSIVQGYRPHPLNYVYLRDVSVKA